MIVCCILYFFYSEDSFFFRALLPAQKLFTSLKGMQYYYDYLLWIHATFIHFSPTYVIFDTKTCTHLFCQPPVSSGRSTRVTLKVSVKNFSAMKRHFSSSSIPFPPLLLPLLCDLSIIPRLFTNCQLACQDRNYSPNRWLNPHDFSWAKRTTKAKLWGLRLLLWRLSLLPTNFQCWRL